MPPVIAAAVVATAISAATTAIVSGLAAITIGSLLTTFAVSLALGGISMALSKKPKGAGAGAGSDFLQGRAITVRQAAAPWRVVYGQVRVGGVIALLHTTNNGSNTNGVLNLVIVFAGHEVEEIGDIYFDDEIVPFSGTAAIGKYSGYVTLRKHLGSPSQIADAAIIANCPGKWTTDHRLAGRAYCYFTLQFDAGKFPSGIPNITAVIKGKKVYDPRTATTIWSDNPALCVADYLTDGDYGLGAVYADEIDEAALIEAANICEEAIPLAAGGTEDRYALNGTFTTDSDWPDIIQGMNTAFAARTVFAGGRWRIHAGAYVAPTITLSEDDIRGPYTVQTLVSRKENFNAVKGVFISPINSWQTADFPAVISTAYAAEDNNETVFKDISLPFTTSASMAQRLAKIELLRARQPITVTLPCHMTAYQCQVPDIINLTISRMGWVAKPFEVATSDLVVVQDSAGAPMFAIDLKLREMASNVYDWNASEEQAFDAAPNTTFPDPFAVGAPSNLQLASGTNHLLELSEGSVLSRIYASWDGIANSFVAEYEVQSKKSADTDWQPSIVVRGVNYCYISPVEDGTSYDVRVRGVNRFGGAGDYTQSLGHIVIGKTEAPPPPDVFNVTRLADGTRRFSWILEPLPPDVRSGGGFEIRYLSGVTSDWNAMTPINETGLIRTSPYETNELAAGSYTFAIKSVDSSGNFSTTGAFLTTDLGDPRLRNVIFQQLEHILNWPGTLTSCYNYFSQLRAISTTGIGSLASTIAGLPATIAALGTKSTPITYETAIFDLGSDVSFTPLITTVSDGTATVTMKTGTTADGSVTGSYVATAPVSSKRYVQFKVSVGGSAPTLSQLTILLDAENQIDEYEDVNTATEASSWFNSIGTGIFQVASKSGAISAITQARISAVQGTDSGYTWSLQEKNGTFAGEPASTFRLFKNGTLSNAVVDIVLSGPKST